MLTQLSTWNLQCSRIEDRNARISQRYNASISMPSYDRHWFPAGQARQHRYAAHRQRLVLGSLVNYWWRPRVNIWRKKRNEENNAPTNSDRRILGNYRKLKALLQKTDCWLMLSLKPLPAFANENKLLHLQLHNQNILCWHWFTFHFCFCKDLSFYKN